MKEGLKRLLVILAVALLSLALYSCKEKQESSVTDKNASTQQTTSEKKPDAQKDAGANSNTQEQQPSMGNQYTNKVNPDIKPTNKAVIRLQVSNASSNANPFHVSLDGSVGPVAPRVSPGGSVSLQKEVSEANGAYPIKLTVSRNGEVIATLNQNLNASNTSVTLTEVAPGQFSAQWR